VHVLESLRDQRGPDECWQLARNLCEQSKDSNSQLYQDEFTRNIVRDGVKLIKERERTGMTLTDFANHAISILAGLSLWHVFALRAYTSDSFRLFTVPMRTRVKPHPLMFTMYFLDEALRRLSTVEAKLRPAEYNKIKFLFRGMENVKVDDEKFFAEGGTELAPLSASDSLQVAINFSKSNYPVIFRFEALGRSRGIEIKTFSVFPREKEFLYSALTGLVLLDVQHLLESELLTINEERRGQRQHVGDKEEFLREELKRVERELDSIVSKVQRFDANAGAATSERIYSVYDVRPMR
jgi:hypothetical protein